MGPPSAGRAGWAEGQGTWQDQSSLRRPRDVLRDSGPSIVPDYKRCWLAAFTRLTVSQRLWELASFPWFSGVSDWPLHLPPSLSSALCGMQTRREGRGLDLAFIHTIIDSGSLKEPTACQALC